MSRSAFLRSASLSLRRCLGVPYLMRLLAAVFSASAFAFALRARFRFTISAMSLSFAAVVRKHEDAQRARQILIPAFAFVDLVDNAGERALGFGGDIGQGAPKFALQRDRGAVARQRHRALEFLDHYSVTTGRPRANRRRRQ